MQASVAAAHGLQSRGSVVVAHEFSYLSACGIFLDQGLNPVSFALQDEFLTTEVLT